MNKLIRSTKIISVILNLIFWIILLGSLLYGFGTAWSSFNMWQNPGAGADIIRINGITLDYIHFYSETGLVIEQAQLLKMNLLSLPVYFLEVPLLCYGIQLLRKILKLVIQQRPFNGTAQILRKMGWISLSVCLIENLTDWALHRHMELSYQLSKLFLGSSITKVTFENQWDNTFLLIAVVVFILSGVFRYGEELQQLSDETL